MKRNAFALNLSRISGEVRRVMSSHTQKVAFDNGYKFKDFKGKTPFGTNSRYLIFNLYNNFDMYHCEDMSNLDKSIDIYEIEGYDSFLKCLINKNFVINVNVEIIVDSNGVATYSKKELDSKIEKLILAVEIFRLTGSK